MPHPFIASLGTTITAITAAGAATTYGTASRVEEKLGKNPQDNRNVLGLETEQTTVVGARGGSCFRRLPFTIFPICHPRTSYFRAESFFFALLLRFFFCFCRRNKRGSSNINNNNNSKRERESESRRARRESMRREPERERGARAASICQKQHVGRAKNTSRPVQCPLGHQNRCFKLASVCVSRAARLSQTSNVKCN